MRALGDGINDGISIRGVADNSEKHRETMPEGEVSAPTNQARELFEAAAAVPHNLAMMLREELDVSYRLGCHAAGRWDGRMEDNEGSGRRKEEGGGSNADFWGTDE